MGEQKRDYMVDNYHLAAATTPVRDAVFLTALAVTKPGAEPPESELLKSPAARCAAVTLPDGRRYLAGFARQGAEQSNAPLFVRELPRTGD